MAMFRCDICDELLDGDWVESFEWGNDEVCIDCHIDAVPEDWEDWEATYWLKPIPDRNHDWELTHKDYNGPGDPRAFTGPTLIDVWQQAIEFNESMETFDPNDDGDYAYDHWKDRNEEKR